MKSNPLFHDSTVSQGANIQTQFELTGVSLKEDEILCLKLIVGDDVRLIEMNEKAQSVYHTSAWIEHRKRISYQFFVEKNGDVISASELKSSLALHTISQVWKPLEGDDWKETFQKNPQVEKSDLSFQGSNESVPQEEYIDNLIDKWDL